MATENLKVKITADASQAKAEIGKFKDSLKDTIKSGDSVTKTLRRVAAASTALAATVKITKAAIRSAIATATAGDAIKDNAQKVFMGTTAYQEWGYVLEQNGVEMSALKTAMRQFAPQVAANTEVLRKYGITATDVDTAFQQAVYAIQNMANETDRITAATELFGSRAIELMPVLNMTNAETQNLASAYRVLGGTMSNELIAASDTCADSITAMKAAWSGLRNVLAAYVIPIVTKVVQWITVAIAYVRILLSAIFGLKSTFGGGGNKKTSLPATTGAVAANTGGAAKNLGKAVKHAKELRRTLMGIDELTKLVEQATAAAASPSGGGGGGVSAPAVGGGDIGSFSDIISDETLNKIESFRKKVEDIKDKLNGAYLILKGITELVFGNPVQGIKDIWEGLKKMFPSLEKVEETFGKLKEGWAKFKATKKELLLTLKDKFSEKKKKLKKKWDNVKKEFKEKTTELKLKISDKFSDVKDKIKKKWDDLKDKFKGKTEEVKLKLSDAFSDAWDKVKKKWDDIKSKTATITISFKNLITDTWNKLAEKVNRGRQNSKLVASLFPQPLPTFAKGGILTAPTAAILGEYAGARSNPEIATPQSLMYETIQRANGDMVSAFAQMTRQVIAAIEDKDLTVSIGDEQIARSAQRGNTAYRSRTGKALLTI